MIPKYQIEGSGPPLVYVSGLDGTGKLFYKQAADLRRDHTVISFPLRGMGRYTMRELVDDLAWIVRDAGFERATVLGESFGGLLSMATALARPEIFERLILVNTFPFFTERLRINLGIALFSILPYPLMKAYRTRAARHVLFSPDVTDVDRRQFHEHTTVVEFEGYASRLRIIRDTDLRARLGEITTPTLVVAGTVDRLINSVGAARVLVEKIPHARLKLLEGTGHTALLSERVRVREWLKEFDNL